MLGECIRASQYPGREWLGWDWPSRIACTCSCESMGIGCYNLVEGLFECQVQVSVQVALIPYSLLHVYAQTTLAVRVVL